MQWATKRRLIVGSIIAAVVLVVGALVATAILYEPPSCTDRKQNQQEEDIDCGGPCPYLCTTRQEAPVTPTPRLLKNADGRVDLVATIENRNFEAAAKDVAYTIKVYDEQLALVRTITGSIDLPPRKPMPIFFPGVVTTGATLRASLEVDKSSLRWYEVADDPRIVPIVSQTVLGGTTAAPRVEATLTNPSVARLVRIPVIVFIRDNATGNVVAASQTVVTLESQADAKAVFTWKEPFAAPSVRIDVMPVVPLP